jgi:hypothetical protein
MSRYFGIDIIDALKDRLNDFTYGVNQQIATINNTRDEAAPAVKNITEKKATFQFPETYIDLMDSETTETTLSSHIDYLSEVYPAEIATVLKDNNDNLKRWGEIHIEALQKCLHGYSTAEITVIKVTGTMREDIYDRENNNNLFLCGVKIEVEIN